MNTNELPDSILRQLPLPDQRLVFTLSFNSALAAGRDRAQALSDAWRTINMAWFRSGGTWVRRNRLKVS